MILRTKTVTYTLLGFCFLSACAPSGGSIEPQAMRESVDKDVAAIYQHGDVTEDLKLEDVLARALRFNLDTRVAAYDELIASGDVTLEALQTLPSITAKLQRVGRSNRGGSSSLSLLTGLESLQPSISSDQYRTTQQLNVQWNLLDAGINVGRTFSASDRALIAQERRRKIYHNVVQDAYSAFWRAAAAQAVMPKIVDLLARSETQLKKIEEEKNAGLIPLGVAHESRARLLEKRKTLLDLKQGMALAEIELKTLIDYPLEQSIKLDPAGDDLMQAKALPVIRGDMDALELAALMNRPEIHEEILNKKISARDIKLSILETIPGLDLILGFNRDSNSFLAEKSWVDGTVGLTQSITKIITAPARYNRAKNVDELADRRREALVAAIMTQVHVARARYDMLAEAHRISEETDVSTQEIFSRAANFQTVGMMSKPELLDKEMDATISRINRIFSYVGAQDAYGRMIATMGVDLWDADNAGLTVPDFARQIKKNLSREEIFASGTVDAKGGG